MVYSLDASGGPPERWERPVAPTFRSAYTFDEAEDDVTFGVFGSFGMMGFDDDDAEETSSAVPCPHKATVSKENEEASLSTTTGTDGSSDEGHSSSSEHLPKSTTSDDVGSPGGSGSDSDRSALSYRLIVPASALTLPHQRRRSPAPSKHARPPVALSSPRASPKKSPMDVSSPRAFQKKSRPHLQNSSSMPMLPKMLPKTPLPIRSMNRTTDDCCVAAAREACASARSMSHRLGSELSDLDEEMACLSEDLKVLKSYILLDERR